MAKGTCSVDGCERECHRRGLCASHSSRLQRHGDAQASVPFRTPPNTWLGRSCSVEGCVRPGRLRRGLCSAHHTRWLRYGDIAADRSVKVTPEGTCSIPKCSRVLAYATGAAAGLCLAHGARVHLFGDARADIALRLLPGTWSSILAGAQPSPEAQEWFWARVVQSDDCWLWSSGNRDRYGYGRIGHHLVHRISFTMVNGPIPDGLTLDHLCRTPPCVRPEHLEPVTQAENNRRAWAARRNAA